MSCRVDIAPVQRSLHGLRPVSGQCLSCPQPRALQLPMTDCNHGRLIREWFSFQCGAWPAASAWLWFIREVETPVLPLSRVLRVASKFDALAEQFCIVRMETACREYNMGRLIREDVVKGVELDACFAPLRLHQHHHRLKADKARRRRRRLKRVQCPASLQCIFAVISLNLPLCLIPGWAALILTALQMIAGLLLV